MNRSCVVSAALALGSLVCACGSTASSLDSGVAPGPSHDAGTSGDTSTGVPDIFLTSTLGGDGGAACSIKAPEVPFFSLGEESAPVSNGGTYDGEPVTLVCSVVPSGGAFAVNISVSQGATNGITVSGALTDTPGSQAGLVATFTSETTGRYSQSNCTFVLSTQGNPAITTGRVWGTLTCDALVDANNNDTCMGTAMIIAQNCAE